MKLHSKIEVERAQLARPVGWMFTFCDSPLYWPVVAIMALMCALSALGIVLGR